MIISYAQDVHSRSRSIGKISRPLGKDIQYKHVVSLTGGSNPSRVGGCVQ